MAAYRRVHRPRLLPELAARYGLIHLTNYFKGLPNFKETRLKLVTTLDVDELFATLDYVAERWGDCDMSGAVPAPLSHDI